MAIGTPTQIGTNAVAGPVNNIVITLTAGAAAGNHVLVAAIAGDTSTTITSIVDSRSNSYQVDKHLFVGGTGSLVKQLTLASCKVGTNLQVGDTITITYGTNEKITAYAYTVSGLATTSWFDQGVIAGAASGTSASSGNVTTLQAAELLFGAIGQNKSGLNSVTAGTGWTKLDERSDNIMNLETQYQIVSSTGTYAASGTLGVSAPWIAGIATYKAAVAGTPPSNTVAPVVSGTTTVGSALSTTNGTWSGDPTITFTYQWQRDNTGGGVYSNITSATSSSYTLVDADDGCNIRCVVTGTNGSGNASANSNSVGTVIEPVPSNSVAPVASGTATVGQSVSTTNGTWSNMGGLNPTFTYQWQRDVLGNGVYSNITSATSSSYTLVDADDACHVRCVVTAHNTNPSSASANSNALGTVVEPVPTNSVAPVASGTAAVNSAVSSTTGTWTHQAGTVATYAYQWQDSADGSTGWANIVGATSSSYTIAVGELNKFLRCNVTATNTGGTSSATSSNTLGPVAAAAASTSNLALFSSAGRFLRMKGLR